MYQKMLLSEKIAETIVSSIKNDFYKIGDQMPNEIQLAEELGVSRATLREAIKILISRNILEVRRGVGTFVSETQGIHQLDTNFDTMNLNIQKMEILRILKQLDCEELMAFQHLSWSDQNSIKSKILTVDNDRSNTLKYITLLFEIVETIAISRHSTFKHRLILQTHEAVKMLMDHVISKENISKENFSIELLVKSIFTALGQDEVVMIFDEFIMQLGFYIQEE